VDYWGVEYRVKYTPSTRRALIASAPLAIAALLGGGRARAQTSPAAPPSAPATGAAEPAFRPAIVYAVGQKFDRSFNEAAFAGAERFRQATGVAYLEVEPRSPAEFESAIPALARRGATDIVAVGYYYATPLATLAPRHAGVRFTLIDAVVEAPNVQSVVWREQEGAFLAGMLAALAVRGPVGFVAALDIPLIRRYTAGFEAGARYVRPDIRVLLNFVGTTPEAFNDPARAAEIAGAQFDRGAEVIFAGAGVSNLGIFQRAAERRRLAIGVDSNQNGLFPGTILTSLIKHVDVAVATGFALARAGEWHPGTRVLGLAEGGQSLAFDEHNARLVTPAMRARVDEAQGDIVAGRLSIPDGTGR
jgi:basic membrane protein A